MLLEGPVDLLFFKFFISESTSSAIVGLIKNDCSLEFLKSLEKSKLDFINLFSIFFSHWAEVIVEPTGYHCGVSYSFIEDLDAIYVFCLFFSKVNYFLYPLPSFNKVTIYFLEKSY